MLIAAASMMNEKIVNVLQQWFNVEKIVFFSLSRQGQGSKKMYLFFSIGALCCGIYFWNAIFTLYVNFGWCRRARKKPNFLCSAFIYFIVEFYGSAPFHSSTLCLLHRHTQAKLSTAYNNNARARARLRYAYTNFSSNCFYCNCLATHTYVLNRFHLFRWVCKSERESCERQNQVDKNTNTTYTADCISAVDRSLCITLMGFRWKAVAFASNSFSFFSASTGERRLILIVMFVIRDCVCTLKKLIYSL